jgi:hypothetical protein
MRGICIGGEVNVVATTLSRTSLITQPGTSLLKAETCGQQPLTIGPGPQTRASTVEIAVAITAEAILPIQSLKLDFQHMAKE